MKTSDKWDCNEMENCFLKVSSQENKHTSHRLEKTPVKHTSKRNLNLKHFMNSQNLSN